MKISTNVIKSLKCYNGLPQMGENDIRDAKCENSLRGRGYVQKIELAISLLGPHNVRL